jgi:hypothetical protein
VVGKLRSITKALDEIETETHIATKGVVKKMLRGLQEELSFACAGLADGTLTCQCGPTKLSLTSTQEEVWDLATRLANVTPWSVENVFRALEVLKTFDSGKVG